MELGDLLGETLSVDCDEVWENERTPDPSGCSGCVSIRWELSLREIVAVFELNAFQSVEGTDEIEIEGESRMRGISQVDAYVFARFITGYPTRPRDDWERESGGERR